MAEGSRHHTHGSHALGFAVLTTTDSRTEKEDETGRTIVALVEAGGHHVLREGLCPNVVSEVQRSVRECLETPGVQVVVTSGGTGVGPKDVTIEALEGLGGRKVAGFGERFRALSFAQVGPLAMLSRSELFLVGRHPVFALPGSTRACQLAVGELILPFVQHLVEELERR